MKKVENLEETIKKRCAIALSYADKKFRGEGNQMSHLHINAVMDDLLKAVVRCVLKTVGEGKA